jgi:hypothetical protein
VDDDVDRLIFISYKPSTGTSYFYADGVDIDNTSSTLRESITGTMPVGAGDITIGSAWNGDWGINGTIGYVIVTNEFLTNPGDFGTASAPTELDTGTWTELGGVQPNYFAYEGDLSVTNLGSDGLMVLTPVITGPT